MNIIETYKIDKSFYDTSTKKSQHVLKQINFNLKRGEFVAIVGESGSGKSTFAKTLIGAHQQDNGVIKLLGKATHQIAKSEKNKIIQMVLQNPYSAFDPLQSIETSLTDVLICNHLAKNKKDAHKIILDALQHYDLSQIDVKKRGRDFSGGQLQRLGILRAMLLRPQILIADEVVSALDNHLKLIILDLLKNLQLSENLSILFITHNIGSIQNYANRIIVFKEGEIIEAGDTRQILFSPQHSYTQRLIKALPKLKD